MTNITQCSRSHLYGLALVLGLILLMAFPQVAAAAAPPVVTGISPTSGSADGGLEITFVGHGFTDATSVAFGADSAVPTVVNDGRLTVIAPPHAPGLVHLRVTTPADQSASTSADNFTYLTGPVVSGIDPASGPIAGGTSITISGSGFSGATAVAFGSGSVVPTVVDSTTITVVSPAHAAGLVHLRVTGPSGTSPSTTADNFTYVSPPVVTAITPTSGSTHGGTVITITGSGLTGATAVAFGATSVTPSVVSDTEITVTSPAHAAGTVHLRVTGPGGQSAATSADDYMYVAGPVVLGIAPPSGSPAGGTLIVITGFGFTGATSVAFGLVSIAPTVLSDTTITVVSPPGASGTTVHLRVTTPDGTSPSTVADNFLYLGAPVVLQISPATGSTLGGTVITIVGSGMTGATSVSFGDVSVIPTVVSDTSLVVTSPPNPAGVVHLKVTTPAGASADTAADNFTYVFGPTVFGISPDRGPLSGGTTITISGSGFTGALSVSFGNVSVAPISVSDSRVVVVSPARDVVGVVHLRVRTAAGLSPSTDADDFTYTDTGLTYTLTYRWTLLVWVGHDGASVFDALHGHETPDNPTTNDVYALVSVVFRWNGSTQGWEGYFPGYESMPGVNDFTAFSKGIAYWVALRTPGTYSWTVAP
jgi:hypothetical protein